jgi:putative transposase
VDARPPVHRPHGDGFTAPARFSRAIRTTNLLERLFTLEPRRLKIIRDAFAEKPVLKLMFGAMIRAPERWRAIKITPFEGS